MRFVPTRVHGTVDYVFVVATAAVPFVLGGGGVVAWVAAAVAVSVLLYSLVTDYELGVIRALSVRTHLWLDAAVGVALLVTAAATSGDGVAPTTIVLAGLGVFSLVASACTRLTTSEGAGLAGPSALQGVSAMSEMPRADRAGSADGRPAPPPLRGTGVETLRGTIDSGAGGDKIAMTDPSMSPLGSDDEAAEPHDERGLATARQARR